MRATRVPKGLREGIALRHAFNSRGVGEIAESALHLRARVGARSNEHGVSINDRPVTDKMFFECGLMVRGQKASVECKLVGTACTSSKPIAACKVVSVGAFAAMSSFGHHRKGSRAVYHRGADRAPSRLLPGQSGSGSGAGWARDREAEPRGNPASLRLPRPQTCAVAPAWSRGSPQKHQRRRCSGGWPASVRRRRHDRVQETIRRASVSEIRTRCWTVSPPACKKRR